MFTAMPTPVRVFYNADGIGDCPLTVREGRSWLNKEFETEPEIKEIPCMNIEEDIENPALSLKELWFRYEKEMPDIVKGFNLAVKKGELFCLLGGNGTGKTTALSLISGLNTPYRGAVLIKGQSISKIKSLYKLGNLAIFKDNRLRG